MKDIGNIFSFIIWILMLAFFNYIAFGLTIFASVYLLMYEVIGGFILSMIIFCIIKAFNLEK